MTSHSSITLPGLGEVPVVALGTIGDGSVPPGFGSDDEEPIFLPLIRRRDRGGLGYGLSSVSMLTSMAMAARFGGRGFSSSWDRDAIPDINAIQSEVLQQARRGQPGLLDIHRRVAELSRNVPRPADTPRPAEPMLSASVPRANWRWDSIGRSSDDIEDPPEMHHADSDSDEEAVFRSREAGSDSIYGRGRHGHSDEGEDEEMVENDSEDEGELYTEYFDEEEEENEADMSDGVGQGPSDTVGVGVAAPALRSSGPDSVISSGSSRARHWRSSRRSVPHDASYTASGGGGGRSDTGSQEMEPLLAAHRGVAGSLLAPMHPTPLPSDPLTSPSQTASGAVAPPPTTTATTDPWPRLRPASAVDIPPQAASSRGSLTPGRVLAVPARSPPARRRRSLAFAWAAAARFALSAVLAPLRLFLSITGLSERTEAHRAHSPRGPPVVLSAAVSLSSGMENPLLVGGTRACDPGQQPAEPLPSFNSLPQHGLHSGAGPAPPIVLSSPAPRSPTVVLQLGASEGCGGVRSTPAARLLSPPSPRRSTRLVGAPTTATLPVDVEAVTRASAEIPDGTAAGASGRGSGRGHSISASRGASALRNERRQPQSQLGQGVFDLSGTDGDRVLSGNEVVEEPGGGVAVGDWLPSFEGASSTIACRPDVALPMPQGSNSNGRVVEGPGIASSPINNPSPALVGEVAAGVIEPALSSAPSTAQPPLDAVSTTPTTMRTLTTGRGGGPSTRARHTPARPRLAWQAAVSGQQTATATHDSGGGPADDTGVEADTESSDAKSDTAAGPGTGTQPEDADGEGGGGLLLGGRSTRTVPHQGAGGCSHGPHARQGRGVGTPGVGETNVAACPRTDPRTHRTPARQWLPRRGQQPLPARLESAAGSVGLLARREGAASNRSSGTALQRLPQQTQLVPTASQNLNHDDGVGGVGDGGHNCVRGTAAGSFGGQPSLPEAIPGADHSASSHGSISPVPDSAAPIAGGGNNPVDAWRDTELSDLEEIAIAMQAGGEAATESVGGATPGISGAVGLPDAQSPESGGRGGGTVAGSDVSGPAAAALERRLSVPHLTDATSTSDGSVFDDDDDGSGGMSGNMGDSWWRNARTFSLRGLCQAGDEVVRLERITQPGSATTAAAATATATVHDYSALASRSMPPGISSRCLSSTQTAGGRDSSTQTTPAVPNVALSSPHGWERRGSGEGAEPSSGGDSDEVVEVWLSPHRWRVGNREAHGVEGRALYSFEGDDRRLPLRCSDDDEEEDVEEEDAVVRWSLPDTPPPPLFSDDDDKSDDDSRGHVDGDGGDDDGNGHGGDDMLPPLFSDEDDSLTGFDEDIMAIRAAVYDLDSAERERSRGQLGADNAEDSDSAGISDDDDDDDEPPALLSSGDINTTDLWDMGPLNPPPPPPLARSRAVVVQPPHPRPPPTRMGPTAAAATPSTSGALPAAHALPPPPPHPLHTGTGAHAWMSDPWLVPLSRAAAPRPTASSNPSASGGASAPPTRAFTGPPIGPPRPQAPEQLPRAASSPHAAVRSSLPPLLSSSNDDTAEDTDDEETDGIRRLGRRIHTFGRRLQQVSNRAAALAVARREAATTTAATAAASAPPAPPHGPATASTASLPSAGGGLRLELGAAAEAVLEALVPALLGAAGASGGVRFSGVGGGGGATASGHPMASFSHVTAPDTDRTRRPRPAGVTTQILSAVIRLPADALTNVPNGSVLSITLPPLVEGAADGSGSGGGGGGGAGAGIGTATGTVRLQLGGVSSFPMSWRSYLPPEDANGRNPNDRPWLPGTYEEHEIPAWAGRFAPPRSAEASERGSPLVGSGDTSPRGTEVGAGGDEGAPHISSSTSDPRRNTTHTRTQHNTARTADTDPAGRPALWEDFSFATDSAESIDSLPDLVSLDYVAVGSVPSAHQQSLPAEPLPTRTAEAVPRRGETRSVSGRAPLSQPPLAEAHYSGHAGRMNSTILNEGDELQADVAAVRRSGREDEVQDPITEVWRTGSGVTAAIDQARRAMGALEGRLSDGWVSPLVQSLPTPLPGGPASRLESSPSELRPLAEEEHGSAGGTVLLTQVDSTAVGSVDTLERVLPSASRRTRSASLPMGFQYPPAANDADGDAAAPTAPPMSAGLEEESSGAADESESTRADVAEQELAPGAEASGSGAVGLAAIPAARRNASTHLSSRILQDILEVIHNVEAAAASVPVAPWRLRLAGSDREIGTVGSVPVAGEGVGASAGVIVEGQGHWMPSEGEVRRQVAIAALLRDEEFVGGLLEGMVGVEAHPPVGHVAETVRWMLAGPLAPVNAM